MTVCGNNSIIGTDHASGSVYGINIDSGEKLLPSREVRVPEELSATSQDSESARL